MVRMAHDEISRLRLQVRVEERDGIETAQLIPWVDDSVLALGLATTAESASSGLGADPDELLGRHSPLLPPGSDSGSDIEPPLVTVWRGGSDDAREASIALRVGRERAPGTDDVVVWDDWRMRFGEHASPGPLRFDTRAYYAELIRAHGDRSWESTPRRVARELTGVLDARPEILAEWGAALIRTRGYRHGDSGVVEVFLRDTGVRQLLKLSCSATGDAEIEARRLARLLAGTDPATLPAQFRSTVL